MEKNKILSLIQEDIGKIEVQLNNRNGSGELWENLKVKYSIILPEFIKHVKASGKIAAMGQEFDYRPELKKLKTAFLTWITVNENELEFSMENIDNEAKALLQNALPDSVEEEIKNLILESKIYIVRKDFIEKKIGLEKIWDAFERIKTIKSANKKQSAEKIISEISNNDKELEKLIDDEFRLLTTIGNSYSIRHHEMDQRKLPNNQYVEYFYFRMLSLISCVLNLMND